MTKRQSQPAVQVSANGHKCAALYTRVSTEIQASENSVSLPQQQAETQALCQRSDWQVIGEFVDDKDYKATQSPKKGTVVNPSGERADRPQFLAMLEVIKSGAADAVVCWRDDRLVRHPRVASALEDALDLGDKARGNKPKIQIFDATGAEIDRFVLHIKAVIGREENKRRAERIRIGKVGTLQAGRWPGFLDMIGYTTFRDVGKRGRRIERLESEAHWVIKIHEWYSAGTPIQEIRRRLIAEGAPQSDYQANSRRHDWSHAVVYEVLKNEAYTGKLSWHFGNGTEYTISIPAVLPRELWERNQRRLDQNKKQATRNAGGVYLLQGILYCGECKHAMSVRQSNTYFVDGERRDRRTPHYAYRCNSKWLFSDEPHPKPFAFAGLRLDTEVWRYIADNGIKHPELIQEQIQNRQAELQQQGDNVDGDIAHARQRLADIDQERANYQRQNAREQITDQEFDARMDETKENQQYWKSELSRLCDLRDDADKIRAGLDYTTELLTGLQEELPKIDIPRKELRRLPKAEQEVILRKRQRIIRALCDKITISANGHVEIEGLLDGSEAAQFELPTHWNGLLKLSWQFDVVGGLFARVGAADD
jgi:site-specific DNA recombinase